MNLAAVFENFIVCNGPDCTYADLIRLARVIINNLVVISTIVVVILLVYVGFKLLTSGGDKGAMQSAKEMFSNAVIGYVWILAAWLVVYTIMNTLLKPGYNTILGNP